MIHLRDTRRGSESARRSRRHCVVAHAAAPRASAPPWVATGVGLVLGLALAGTGFAEYHVLGLAEQRGERIARVRLEIAVHDMGGRAAVFSMFALFGLTLFAFALAVPSSMGRKRRSRGHPSLATSNAMP